MEVVGRIFMESSATLEVAMATPEKTILQDGDSCTVTRGTHTGKSGVVRDIHASRSGNITITVVQPSGERFKTLARNVLRVP